KQKTVFITFDDGPHKSSTAELLDILKEDNIDATFFCTGENCLYYPDLVLEIIKAGHQIGNHGFSHKNGWKTQTSEYINDIEKADKIIQSKLFRPPYGKISPKQYHILRKKFTIVLWDLLSYDYDASVTPHKLLKTLIENTRDGSVIVFHDKPGTIQKLQVVLPEYFSFLKTEGYHASILSKNVAI
ncbi:MAG: polysaccharide deacetylase family protein, partial [Marinilabiliales bacterium]